LGIASDLLNHGKPIMETFASSIRSTARETTLTRPRLRGTLLVCLISLICGLSPPICDAQAPIKVGVSLGLTGRFAVMSDALHKGFHLWEKHVNASGGILGRPVQVICEDDQSATETARRLYREFIEVEKVDFLFAPYSSLITEAVLPIAEQHGIPILVAGAAADRLWDKGYRHVIGVYTTASKFVVGFLELLVLNDLDKLAVLNADDVFSIELADSVTDWARRFGLNTVLSEKFEKGRDPLDPLVLKARDAGADVLIVCGHMNEAVNMATSLARIGWRPRARYASVGPTFEAFHDRSGAAADGVFSTALWEPRANYPGAQKFESDFLAAYGESPGYHAGLAYAGGQVLAEAIREAGTTDREQVRKRLFSLDTMTIIGRFGVDRSGKQVRQQAFIIQWQNGRKELVWPEAIRTAKPLF
jgi:branched-chain amino acid transport system substrate-binding protein